MHLLFQLALLYAIHSFFIASPSSGERRHAPFAQRLTGEPLLSAIVLISGCLLGQADPVGAADPDPRPVVFLVVGMGRLIFLGPSARCALPRGRVDYELREFHWQHEKGGQLRDLQDELYLLQKSADLANEIRALRESPSNRPVYLIAHSAGCAVAVHTAELLPARSVERIILLEPALSPTYDLTRALRATRREMVVFTSWLDATLRFTKLFGTADRVYCVSAGVHGFTRPPCLDDEGQRRYERLVQIPWTCKRLLEWQGPWHNSPTFPPYLRRQVARWLLEP
jgi:pimeloyl-ACP methyl ester carboxylesterase